MSKLTFEGVEDLSKYTSRQELHKKSPCQCDRGEEGIREREEGIGKKGRSQRDEKEISQNWEVVDNSQSLQKSAYRKDLLQMFKQKAELQRGTILKFM